MERKAGVGDKGLRKVKEIKGGEIVNEAGSNQPVYDKPKNKPEETQIGAGSDLSVPVEFKTGVRRIDFQMKAIEAIETHYPNPNTGNPTTPISVILRWQQAGFGMSWSQVKVFLWAGMLWETPNMRLEELDDMMDMSKIKSYSDLIDKALQLSFGITDEEIAAAKKAIAEQNEQAAKAAAEKNGPSIGGS
jgi:hypothetical protein